MDAATELSVSRLGVLDWGIGGYGFARLLPAEVGYTYLSDSGFTPYGRVPATDLRRRIEQVARFFSARGVTHLVVACNAASTVVPRARFPAGLRVTDVLSHGVRASLSATGTLGVVGGVRTIRSGAYTRPLRAAGRRVRSRVAQPLSAHIERGDLEGPGLEADLGAILGPLVGVDTLVLACTHYPAIRDAFSRFVPGAALLDPAPAVLAARPPPLAQN
jgi:glutamate racemase